MFIFMGTVLERSGVANDLLHCLQVLLRRVPGGLAMSVNLQTSFLTPPFGFTLFYMKGTVPKEVTMAHIYRGIVPFVILQLIGLTLVIAFPELSLWLPRQAGFLN